MKRVLSIALACLVHALSVPVVVAYDDPHFRGNSVNCLSCHSVHKAAGQNLTLTIANESLCASCHNMAGSASRFPAERLRKADLSTRFGSSHAWNVAPVNPAGGAAVPSNAKLALRTQQNVLCSTCHNQHSNDPVAIAAGTAGPQTQSAAVRIAGTGSGTIAYTGTADATAKNYLIEIVETGGNAGTAKFRLSNDGGLSWFGWSGAAWVTYAVGNAQISGASIPLNDGSKITVTFSGNFAIGDRLRFQIAYPFLRVALDSGDNATGPRFCRDCHAEWAMDHNGVNVYDGTFKSHPVGIAMNANGGGYDYAVPLDANGAAQGGAGVDANPTNDIALDAGGRVQCLSCHGVHHADGNSQTVDLP
jgi:predicted CXXCH cytochrome family protein